MFNRSEGPAQVFLIVLAAVFAHLPRDEVKKKVISYDNMCHLNNLKVRVNNVYYVLIFRLDLFSGCKKTIATTT